MTIFTRRQALLVAGAAGLFVPESACGDIPRVFRARGVPMEPTIMQDEYFSATPVLSVSDIARGDVVAFRHGEELQVKRIIGLGGDRVSFSDGRPTLNGATAEWAPEAQRGALQTFRETLNGRSYLVELGAGTTEVRSVPETIVPQGQAYVVGDSRDRSFDSRVQVFGPVEIRSISHKAITIFRSNDPSRVGRSIE